MKLHEILSEDASAGSVDANSFAGSRGSLFGGGGVSGSMLKRMTPNGGTILKSKIKKRNKVAGVPVLRFKKEA